MLLAVVALRNDANRIRKIFVAIIDVSCTRDAIELQSGCIVADGGSIRANLAMTFDVLSHLKLRFRVDVDDLDA